MALVSAEKAMQQASRDSGWITVVSSNVKRIRHMGAPDNRLFIQFKSGGSGFYSGVPRDVFYRMTRAASKGKFVHRVLIPNYDYTTN